MPIRTTSTNPLRINVETDQRALLFPDGKPVSHLALIAGENRTLTIEGVFRFNETRWPPHIVTLDLDDARRFGRALTDAVYQAKPQAVITDTTRISIVVLPNGYLFQVGEPERTVDLFIGTATIWALIQSILQIVDHASPIASH